MAGHIDGVSCMQYKGYTGSVEFSEADNVFYGKVQGIRSLLSYEGKDKKTLEEDFHGVVDDYLEDCADDEVEPETPNL